MQTSMILEACVENIGEAIRAETQGAHRIELCDNLVVGGTTPSAGTIRIAKKMLSVPIMVLIRPRGGDFVYTHEEFEVMKQDIEFCKQVGVKGVVLGVLNKDGTIDLERTAALIKLARPLSITFHKAIDETNDILGEFKKLLDLGVDRVLTSGGKPTALDGQAVINALVQASQNSVKVLAAGSISSANLERHRQLIRTDEFHGVKIVGRLR